jgi:hypothetical protein
MDDLAICPGLGFSNPDTHFYLASRLQRDRHFYVTSAYAQIRNGCPKVRSFLSMNFQRIVALEPGVPPLLNDLWLMSVRYGGGKWKIPERLFRRNVEQAHVIGFWGSRLAHPFDAKVDSVLAIGQTDDLVENEPGFHATQLYALMTNIDRNRLCGEHLATAVGAEDPHGHLDLFARLTALAHPVGVPPGRLRTMQDQIAYCAGTINPKANAVIPDDQNSEHSNVVSKDALRFSARQDLRSHERVLAINSPSKLSC